MKSFSELLEELRTVQQISKKELAHLAGLTPGYISLLTRGENAIPSKDTIHALANALNLDDKTRTELFQAANLPFGLTSSDAEPGNLPVKRYIRPSNHVTEISELGELPKKQDAKEYIRQYNYDIAISYASEDRTYAEALANSLHLHGKEVFYDQYKKSSIWGQNLYTHLSDIYQNQARYCVIFLSKHYSTKLWTTHEREAAQARALKEQEVYILPIRLDQTVVPGFLTTIAYLNWHEETVDSITKILLEKLE